MTARTAILIALLAFVWALPARADSDTMIIGEWRTETGKSLVCGGEEGNTIIAIATSANSFYLSGGKSGSPEYDAYWSKLEAAFKERRCFVTKQMQHLPDEVVYTGPKSLEAQGKRFKVIGTTIKEEGETYPAFTMTTMKLVQKF